MSLETTSWEEIWAFVVIITCPRGEASCLWGLRSGKSREGSGGGSET